jgi:type IV pilus assembly protein PilE
MSRSMLINHMNTQTHYPAVPPPNIDTLGSIMLMDTNTKRACIMKNHKHTLAGFTLMEMLIVISIIAIMASIAMASYQSSIIKTKRKAAISTLMQVTSEQEEYFVNNKGYATDLTDLGYANTGASGDPFFIDDNGNSSTSTDGIYKVVFASGATARAFTLSAIPINGQTKDTQCATISLASSGVRTTTGTGTASDCFR